MGPKFHEMHLGLIFAAHIIVMLQSKTSMCNVKQKIYGCNFRAFSQIVKTAKIATS